MSEKTPETKGQTDARIALAILSLLRDIPVKATFSTAQATADSAAEATAWLVDFVDANMSPNAPAQCPGCKMAIYGRAAEAGWCVDCEPNKCTDNVPESVRNSVEVFEGGGVPAKEHMDSLGRLIEGGWTISLTHGKAGGKSQAEKSDNEP